MANTGFTLAGAGAEVNVGGRFWNNPGNITAQDGSAAECFDTAGVSNYIYATNFGFAISTSATINGIIARVRRRTGYGSPTDAVIQLLIAGSPTGSNKAAGGAWPGSFTNLDYGSSSDLWGLTPTASQINASNFGLALQCNMGSGNPLVDTIWFDIYYTLPAKAAPVFRKQTRFFTRRF